MTSPGRRSHLVTAETPDTGLTDAEVNDLYPRWLQKASFTHLTDAVNRILAARAKPAPSGDEREALATCRHGNPEASCWACDACAACHCSGTCPYDPRTGER